MRVLLAPDSFTGTLTAGEAAGAMAAGWARQAPDDDLQQCPLSDGGPGFVDVLGASLPGRLELVMVPGPLGEPVPAQVLVVEGGGGTTAYVETAQACGLHLVPSDRRDPGRTTTLGVAGLLLAARAAGADRIVVGLGGSGTNDGGAGMLGGLLADATGRLAGATGRLAAATGRLAGGGEALRGIAAGELTGLAALRDAWADVEIAAASDVDVPLLGLHGASAGFAEQKGATAEQAQRLELAVGDFAAAACDAAGQPRSLAREPGAGAAGGLGFGLLLLGGSRVPGAGAVLDAVRFRDRVEAADLVVTGEGSFDRQSLRGKVVSAVAAVGLEVGRPVIVVAGQVLVGRREALSIGVESAYAVAGDPAGVTVALADPAGSLAARAQRVARTWSASSRSS
ncbi:MAG: glycerate kinase family protein [Kineosporiaceae bacterium]